MSLLLDALKKAEKAKDDAKRRAQSGSDPDKTVLQVRTRNELPDISSPPEIHSEDVPGGNQNAESYSLVPDAFSTAPAPRPAREAPPAPTVNPPPAPDELPKRRQAPNDATAAPDPIVSQRAAAKNVFETKFREPNPKLPFYITLAVLGAFAVGTVVYFWYQLRPPPSLVNTNAKPPPDEKKVAAAPPPANPAATTAGVSPQLSPAIPGLPGQPLTTTGPLSPVVTQPTPPAAPAPGIGGAPKQQQVQDSRPSQNGSPRAETPAPRAPAQSGRAPAPPSKLSVHRAVPLVHPKLQAGWLAYNQGDLAVARSNYEAVVRDEPSNRDALLGMAALEVRANRPAEAESYYRKLLEINPRDPHAQAGLLALRAHMTDPVQAESKVKSLLASDPEAHVLYFTLGNEYAQQQRWPEAQQAYFKAFSADPENPDFAYNLAVSLDHVRQPKLALEYYRRAISLAQQRSSNFDQNLARNRVQELAR